MKKTIKNFVTYALAACLMTACSKDDGSEKEPTAFKLCEVEGITFRYEHIGDQTIETSMTINGNTTTKHTEEIPENLSFADYANKACNAINEKRPADFAEAAAIVYEHCNYNGWTVALSEGDYNLDDLAAIGVPNDKLSSVRVSAGYGVTLYEHSNYDRR